MILTALGSSSQANYGPPARHGPEFPEQAGAVEASMDNKKGKKLARETSSRASPVSFAAENDTSATAWPSRIGPRLPQDRNRGPIATTAEHSRIFRCVGGRFGHAADFPLAKLILPPFQIAPQGLGKATVAGGLFGGRSQGNFGSAFALPIDHSRLAIR